MLYFLTVSAQSTTASAPLTKSVTTVIFPIDGNRRYLGDNRLLLDHELQL